MTFGTGTLRRGSTGTGVTELQQWLIDRNFLIALSAPTGTFDETTEHAVKAFQFSAGIGVDGAVGGGTRSAADAFTGTATTTGWHPTAIRNIQRNTSGGSFTTDTRRGVLHTTEGSRLPSYDNPPHFTIGRNGAGQPVSLWQHYPITVAARALAHPSGTPQTNRHGAVQIEIIGSAADSPDMPTADPDLFNAIGQWMRWVETNAGVAQVANHRFDGNAAFGLNGSVRLSDADWLASTGWLGHQHVPHNTHWDPGEIDIATLVAVLTPAPAPAPAPAPTPASPPTSSTPRRSTSPTAPTQSLAAAGASGSRPSIRATTRRLSNTFPSLAFSVDPAGHPYFGVVLTTDRSLFTPEGRHRRNALNFYTSLQDELKESERAQGRCVAPVHAVKAFADASPDGASIFYTVVGYADAEGNGPVGAAEPAALARSAPSVTMLPGFRGHTVTEAMGVPLGLLKPSRRHAVGAGGGPRRGASGTALALERADLPAVRPADGAAIDPATDRAEGEDGYDHRLSNRPAVDDIPPDLRPAAGPLPAEGGNGNGGNGGPVAAPSPAVPPPAAGSLPAEGGNGNGGNGGSGGNGDAASLPSSAAALAYDDGFGAWEEVEALESTFPTGQVPPAPIPGVEAPVLGVDDEYDDLGWAGTAYSEGSESTTGPSAETPPDNGAAAPITPGGLPTGWRPPAPRLSAAEKRDVVEAYVGSDTDLYEAVNLDGEFEGRMGTDHPAYQHHHLGLSYGIVGFNQDSGELGQLLTLMRRRDPDRFVEIFGPDADELVDMTNRPGPLSKDTDGGRSVRVQPVAGADVWQEPWVARFAEAGRHQEFRAAQIELASALYLDPTLRFAADLGLATPRGLAMVFDRAAHRGVTGGLTWVVETVGPLQTPTLLDTALRALGIADIESFQRSQPDLLVDDQFGPLTHAAMTAALRSHPGLAEGSPVPVMGYRQMLDELAQRATGQAWGDRIVRLNADASLSDEPVAAVPVA